MFLNGIFDPSILSFVQSSLASNDSLNITIKMLLKKLGVGSVSVKGSIPTQGSVLIISNHPGVFDSIAMLSTATREDLYFTALNTYSIFGPKISRQLLPIYRKRKINHFLYEYPLSLQLKVPFQHSLPKEDIQKRNRDTIARAAELINTSHAVSIFPTGSAGKELKGSKWKPGVGYLVKQINNPNTKVIFGHIKGTKQTDVFAYMQPVIKKLLFKAQPISITFSEPHKLAEMINNNFEPKQIALELEKKYEQWLTNL